MPKGISTPEVAQRYLAGESVCEIATSWPRGTKGGVVTLLRSAGVSGLAWCRVHRALERVELHPQAGLDRHHLG